MMKGLLETRHWIKDGVFTDFNHNLKQQQSLILNQLVTALAEDKATNLVLEPQDYINEV